MYKKYTVLLLFFFALRLSGAVIGSDSAVQRFNNQVTANNGDYVGAFTGLNGGLVLANSSAIVGFNSFFGSTGPIQLSGGTLDLNKDLFLQNVSTLSTTGTGTINGAGNRLALAPGMGIINSNFLLSNMELLLNNDLIIQDSLITFTGTCILSGDRSLLTLNGATAIIIGTNSMLTLKDLTIRKVDGNKIRTVDDTGVIVFNNVKLMLDGNYSFTLGSFQVQNQLILDGGFTFNYQTDLQSTITSNAQLILQNGVTFNYAPRIASKILLQLQDSTASIMINGSTLSTTTTGIQLTKGSLFIDGQSFFSNAGTVAAQAIEFGDGVSVADNLNIEILPAAQLQLLQGFLRDRNV